MPTRSFPGHLKVCDRRIVWADESAHALLGYPAGGLAGLRFDALHAAAFGESSVPDGGAMDWHRVALRLGQGGEAAFDLRAERMDDGSMLWTCHPAAAGARGRRHDVLARHDALTRLPNRLPAVDALFPPADASDGGQVAVCYLDLDRFRSVNEHLGPVGGDAILREVARRLKTAVPPGATVARVGGDEFAFALPVASRGDCRQWVETLLAGLAHPYRLQEGQANLQGSIGVALGRRGAQSMEGMLRHAQQAAFLAKRAGGGRLHFFDVEEAQAHEQVRRMRQGIGDALARREFRLAYQPKVDMAQGLAIGVEALVRWQHPEQGLLPPAQFVSLIEDDELIEQLGDWALGEAVRQAGVWRAGGLDIPISVNISPRHMLRQDFAERLEGHLSHLAAPQAGVLELEILETTAIRDFAAVARLIERCKALGVAVMLDDFGTGYSSLTYLRNLPVVGLKLDQSYVRGMLDNTDDRAIVESILALARALGCQTVAEGVASVAHGWALMELGCTLGQGYGIARPMPPAEVPAWIAGFEAAPPWGRGGAALQNGA